LVSVRQTKITTRKVRPAKMTDCRMVGLAQCRKAYPLKALQLKGERFGRTSRVDSQILVFGARFVLGSCVERIGYFTIDWASRLVVGL